MAKGPTSPVVVILGNILGVILIMLALEGAARIFFPRDVSSLFSDRNLRLAGRPFVEPHPIRGFALKPGFESGQYRINEAGFRGAPLPQDPKEHVVILAMGESTTFGWEVPEGANYPALLEERLNTRLSGNRVRVINAGVPSYSSSQVRLYLEELLAEMKPDLVLINILWNDIWFSTLNNWYPDVLVFQQPAAWQQFMLKHSGVYRAIVIREAEESSQRDVFNQRAFEFYLRNVREMLRLCRDRGVEAVLIHPAFDGAHMRPIGINPFNQIRLSKRYFIELSRTYLDALEALGAEHDVPLVDHRLSTRNPEQPSLFLDLLHPTPMGNKLMADDIADYLLETGRVPRSDPSSSKPTEASRQGTRVTESIDST